MTPNDANHALDRLLGPAEPEATCDECFEQLDIYVDREALHGDAAEAMPSLAAHLRGCPACAEDHDSLLALVTSNPDAPNLGAQRGSSKMQPRRGTR